MTPLGCSRANSLSSCGLRLAAERMCQTFTLRTKRASDSNRRWHCHTASAHMTAVGSAAAKPSSASCNGVARPPFPKSMLEFQRQFASEEACQDYVAACRSAGRVRVSLLRTPAQLSPAEAPALAMRSVPVPGLVDGRYDSSQHQDAGKSLMRRFRHEDRLACPAQQTSSRGGIR